MSREQLMLQILESFTENDEDRKFLRVKAKDATLKKMCCWLLNGLSLGRWPWLSNKWAKIDWSKSNGEIAAEFGVTKTYVASIRSKLLGGTRRTDWSKVDWSKSTATLARELGHCTKTISNNRRKYGRPSATAWRTVDWLKIDWSKSSTEIAVEVGCPIPTVSLYRKKYSVCRPCRRFDWSGIDWSKSDKEIAAELNTVVANVRHARKRHDSKIIEGN